MDVKQKLSSLKTKASSSRSLRNAGFGALDHAILPVMWMLAAPVFIHRLGADRYGIWMLINGLIGINGVFTFGLSDATIKYVSHYRALEDYQGVNRIVRSTLLMYIMLGLFAGAVIALLAPLLSGWFKVEPTNVGLLVTCLRICGLGMLARMFDSVFLSILQGFERYDLGASTSMFANILTISTNVVLVVCGFGLEAVLLSTVTVLLLSALIKMALLKIKVMPTIDLRPSFDPTSLRETLGFGVYSWLHGISSLLIGQADRFIIATTLGTKQLAYFTVCVQLAQQIHALPARASAFLLPMASAARAMGDMSKLRQVYYQATMIVTVAAIACGLPVFLLAKNILTIWMGASFATIGTPILQLLAINFTLMATTIVPYYYLIGAGHVRLNLFLGLFSGLSTVVAAFLLIPVLGINGAAWGRLAVVPSIILARVLTQYWVLDDRRWYAVVTVLGPITLAYALAEAVLLFFPTPTLNFIQLGFSGVFVALVAAAITGPLAYLFIMPRSERLNRA